MSLVAGSNCKEGNTQGNVKTYNKICKEMYQSIIAQEKAGKLFKSTNPRFRPKSLNG